jgi:hypothetical protein
MPGRLRRGLQLGGAATWPLTARGYVINGEGALVYKGGIDDQPGAAPGPEERQEFCRPGVAHCLSKLVAARPGHLA